MSNKLSVKDIVNKLDLQSHPEGGYYKETYRSPVVLQKKSLGEGYNSERNVSTGIYFLLTSENFSAFHKINQDELWHFHLGSAIKLHIITKDGKYQSHLIGNDILNGEHLQFTVQGGDWFAAEVVEQDSYSLISCTVAPGFDFADFKLADRDDLIREFPNHEDVITSLTRN